MIGTLRPTTSNRIGVTGIFAINGFVFAMWVVHIPSIESRTSITHATLGFLLLVLAAGAIVGMQTCGPLTDRIGSRSTVLIAASALSLSVIAPALATNAVQLGIALLILGFFNGAVDVAMNARAAETEVAYGYPIMSSFHALFSVGGVIGSAVGAATLHAGLSPTHSLAGSAVAGLVVTAASGTALATLDVPIVEMEDTGRAHGQFSPRVLLLGTLAFALFLAEGVANDWSALQVKEHLDAPASTAALAFGGFALMMTVGRFCADRVSGAVGPVAVVRYGTLIAALGMTVVIASPWVALTIAGWAVFGLGLSGCIPQIFTAAGKLGGGASATTMSRIVGMGYIGLLAGPAVLGWLTAVIPLTAAMTVPLVAALVASAAAGKAIDNTA